MRLQRWLWTAIPASAFTATPKEKKERKEGPSFTYMDPIGFKETSIYASTSAFQSPQWIDTIDTLNLSELKNCIASYIMVSAA